MGNSSFEREQFKKILELVKRTGDRFIVLDESGDPFVVMDIDSYIDLIDAVEGVDEEFVDFSGIPEPPVSSVAPSPISSIAPVDVLKAQSDASVGALPTVPTPAEHGLVFAEKRLTNVNDAGKLNTANKDEKPIPHVGEIWEGAEEEFFTEPAP